MADITAHSGRDLNYVSANVRIKYRDSDGVVREYTKADLLADTAKQTEILTKIGIVGATRIENRKLNYSVNGSSQVLDTAGGVYQSTWKTGTKIAYTTTPYQSSLFIDAGATA